MGQTIDVTAARLPVMVEGDAGRLEQVLLNLLTNAINYAPGTERIDGPPAVATEARPS